MGQNRGMCPHTVISPSRHTYRGRPCTLHRWLVKFASVFAATFFILLIFQMSQLTRYEHSKDTVRIRKSSIKKTEKLVSANYDEYRQPEMNNEETHKYNNIPSKDYIENSQTLKLLQKIIFENAKRPSDSTYNLNVTLSEHISLDRDVPDTRPPQCRDLTYDVDTLPTVTVVFPFYNEALSMLLRAVHSVLRRSPDHLVSDVILVDDASPNADLKQPLATYVRHLPKVRLVRNSVRQGLIRSRLTGARLARGEVLVFLDAHTEVNVDWLEPLLHEIWRDPRKVLQPTVDQVEADSIEYTRATSSVPRGGFAWDLRYVWMQMPFHETRRLAGSKTQPFRTPTLMGCAIAVSKKYFEDIGLFDDGLNIWGGENIELAFRVWQCGGQVLTVPCSRVGHTFKPFSYKFDGDKEAIVAKNLMRVAEMWMDEYKKYYYASSRVYSFKNVDFTPDEQRSLNQRKKLRDKLQCKPFKWYMENIVPEIRTPPGDAYLFGEPRNGASSACFYVLPDGYVTLTYFCFIHRIIPENMFHITRPSARLMYKERCVHVVFPSLLLKVGPCNTDVHGFRWAISGKHCRGLLYVTSEKLQQQHCAMQVTQKYGEHKGKQMVQLVKCDGKNWYQVWDFTYRFEYKYVPKT